MKQLLTLIPTLTLVISTALAQECIIAESMLATKSISVDKSNPPSITIPNQSKSLGLSSASFNRGSKVGSRLDFALSKGEMFTASFKQALNTEGYERLLLKTSVKGAPVTISFVLRGTRGKSYRLWYQIADEQTDYLELNLEGFRHIAGDSRLQSVTALLEFGERSGGVLSISDLLLEKKGSRIAARRLIPRSAIAKVTEAQELLVNGGFEQGVKTWSFWGEWDGGKYRVRDSSRSKTGEVAAEIYPERQGRGGIFQSVKIIQPGTYELSYWIKSKSGKGRAFAIVEGPENFGESHFDVSSKWIKRKRYVEIERTGEFSVYIFNTSSDTVYIDDVSLKAGVIVPEEANYNSNNLLVNPSFELGSQNWSFWGSWDGGEYTLAPTSEKESRSGSGVAKIFAKQKGRGGVFQAVGDLEPGEYEYSYWIKAAGDHVESFGMHTAKSSSSKYLKKEPVEKTWQRKSLKFTIKEHESEVLFYVFHTGYNALLVDDVSVERVDKTSKASHASSKVINRPSRSHVEDGKLVVNNKAFFPIGVYHNKNLSTMSQLGFNSIITTGPNKKTLDSAYQNCLAAFVSLDGAFTGRNPNAVGKIIEPVINHPAIVSWYLADEPDHRDFHAPPSEIFYGDKLLRSLNPNRATMVLVMSWADSNFYQYLNTTNILATDIYPRYGDEDKPLKLVARQTASLERANPQGPNFVTIEYSEELDLQKQKAQTYMALVSGADGIFYWPGREVIKHPEAARKVVEELRLLSPIFLSPSKRSKTSNLEVSSRDYYFNDRLVVVMVNNSEQHQIASYELPSGYEIKPISLFKSESVFPSPEGGKLTLGFTPYERKGFFIRRK